MGSVTPFALKDVDGLLHEPAPPHLSSGLYARDYDEVKTLGARVGSSRTAAQTSLALFYSGNFFVQMNAIARSVALARLSDIGDSARLLALANLSAADALIVSWNNKRTYNFWRPSTAIAEGDNDGNPRTAGDPSWLPLFNDPPYPDYTSGANSITSAFMRTLALFFDDDTYTFTATTTVAGQPARTYTRFSAVADDVVNARIYMGIHFRFADEVARRQGKQAADWAFSQPPLVGARRHDAYSFSSQPFRKTGLTNLLASALLVKRSSCCPTPACRGREGDRHQRQPLGVRRRDAEVGAARVAALAGADPVQHVARRARQQLRRQHVLGPARRRQQPHAFAALARRHDSLGADEHRAVAGQNSGLRRTYRFAEHLHSRAARALPRRVGAAGARRTRGRRPPRPAAPPRGRPSRRPLSARLFAGGRIVSFSMPGTWYRLRIAGTRRHRDRRPSPAASRRAPGSRSARWRDPDR